MNRSIALGLAMLARGAIGATAVNGLHAQGKREGQGQVTLRHIEHAAELRWFAHFGPRWE